MTSELSPVPPFVHRIRVRYAECDAEGVVFNANWLTYFDEACTRFVETWGFGPDFWIVKFDVMLVKAVVEWSGPARFDEWIDVSVVPVQIGRKSFEMRYEATVGGRLACTARITYVAIDPGSHASIEVPDPVRAVLAARGGEEGVAES